MIAIDANLLVYAHVTSYEQHEATREWLEEQLSILPRVGLPWPSLLAFVRLVTNPRLFSEPEPITDAWAQVESWLDAGSAWTPVPTPQHRQVLGSCVAHTTLRANDVPDAHLAALAIEHGLKLATSDSGFGRFERLEWFNPLRQRPRSPLA
ncbi:MAG: TA system VapC family ribonuclease toxin [Egibacteraceae bacterium]